MKFDQLEWYRVGGWTGRGGGAVAGGSGFWGCSKVYKVPPDIIYNVVE